MISLIKNELTKIFAKKASWIYIIILFLAVIAVGILQQKVFDLGPSDPNWREDVQAEINEYQKILKENPEDEWTMELIQQNQSYLDENIDPNAYSSWHFMNGTVIGMTMLITLFSVIVGSAVVSSEFADGTIKQLLIRPHRRWEILLSKYIATLIYSFSLLVALIIFGYIVGLVLFGAGDFNTKFFETTLDGYKLAVVGDQFVLKVLYYLPSLLIIVSIAFMLSTIFKSQALAVGIGIFVLFLSSTLGGIIVMIAEKFAWAKLLIFPHLDLTVYALQDHILQDVTLPMSLLILAVYYIIFMVLTFIFFQKRDIII
ncbi:ABC transporter permease subunit [Ureibacillus sp. Re31]|uniref:ABC transporter permease subunit n=1 Tax=Ureibacillus galli TaxID=2762222 RepID=A0ABR8XDW1_9BACL|nr:ABC transporter permease subunit [Ureibacillus galli]MBD8027405.1 ABC transporter permease subunit [Ureibacillus galli]